MHNIQSVSLFFFRCSTPAFRLS